MRHRSVAVAAAVVLATTPWASGPAAHGYPVESAGVVLDWEQAALRTIYTDHATPIPVGALYLGFTSLAVYEAVESAHRHRGASISAAAAVAAHDVLVEYFPTSKSRLDADLATSLADVPDGHAETRGARIGARAAQEMVQSRKGDGRDDTSIVYANPPAPGTWQPPEGGEMLAPWLGFVDPLVSRRAIKVDGPDPITGAGYASDYAEVKRVGRATDADRTLYQTETALFFNDNIVVLLSDALVRHLEERAMSLRSTARLFARVHGAVGDSIITTWRLKYDVGFWRPFQAIQGADTDENPATVPDPAWTPLLPNPPYSDYVSGHAGVTGPTVEVIRRSLGDETPLVLRSAVTGTERTYRTLSALEFDAFHARIWGGLHFRDAMEDGYRIGHAAARRAMGQLR